MNSSVYRRAAALGVVAALALSTVACSAGSGSTTKQKEQSTKQIRIGLIAEPRTLDFTQDDGAAIPQALLVNVYEGLVKLDEKGQPVPLLAKSWTVSPDNKVYTFTLQDKAKFSSGKNFTAEDAKFSIERVKSPDWKPSVKAAMDVVDKVDVLSPTKLQVTLKQPSNMWLFKMATRVGAMFSKDGIENLANKPNGTGPFVLEKWTRGDNITFAKNPHYWGKKPGVDKVVLRYFKDPTSMNNALQSGGIDVVSTVQAPDTLPQFEKAGKYNVIKGTTNGEVVLSFNDGKKPFTDKRVRQAIKYAIDHKALLDTAWAGQGQLIGSMVPPTDPWYEDLTGLYPYDKTKAQDLLKQAGYPKGKLTLRLRIPTLPYAEASAQVIKSQLADVGVTVTIEPLEFPARWLDEVFTKADYDMSIIGHVEPRDILSWGNPEYYWRYDNKDLQKLLTEADAGTVEDQTTKLKEAGKILAEDAAADWLFLMPNLVVTDKDVQGYPKDALSESLDLTTVTVSSSESESKSD